MPEEWERRLDQWMSWNEPRKSAVNGALAPSASEEILIYQTLLGAWPVTLDRMKEFVTKSLREAKQNSSWIAPQEEYENAVHGFVERILSDEENFVPSLREFHDRIAVHGARNGLAQLLLKIAAPGVPDFYQGAELWQLTLVDPDNRRPVDYKRITAMLETLRRRESEDRIALIRELAANPQQDEMKLFVTYRALHCRKSQAELFARGEYIPLQAEGPAADHVCAFARRLGDRWAVVVAPRWTATLKDWAATSVPLPEGEWTDALTGLIPRSNRLGDLLSEFPVALLTK